MMKFEKIENGEVRQKEDYLQLKQEIFMLGYT